MDDAEARIEDLEQALRTVVLVLDPLHSYPGIDKEHAAVSIAVEALGLDAVPPGRHWYVR